MPRDLQAEMDEANRKGMVCNAALLDAERKMVLAIESNDFDLTSKEVGKATYSWFKAKIAAGAAAQRINDVFLASSRLPQ